MRVPPPNNITLGIRFQSHAFWRDTDLSAHSRFHCLPFHFLFPKVTLGHQDVVEPGPVWSILGSHFSHILGLSSEFGVIGVMQVTWRLFNLEGRYHCSDGEEKRHGWGRGETS